MDNVSNQTKSEKKGVMSSRSSKPGPILTPYQAFSSLVTWFREQACHLQPSLYYTNTQISKSWIE